MLTFLCRCRESCAHFCFQILVTALALAMFVVPAFIIIVCYVMIIVTVFRKAKLMAVNAGKIIDQL